jgi:hypothetical protein
MNLEVEVVDRAKFHRAAKALVAWRAKNESVFA